MTSLQYDLVIAAVLTFFSIGVRQVTNDQIVGRRVRTGGNGIDALTTQLYSLVSGLTTGSDLALLTVSVDLMVLAAWLSAPTANTPVVAWFLDHELRSWLIMFFVHLGLFMLTVSLGQNDTFCLVDDVKTRIDVLIGNAAGGGQPVGNAVLPQPPRAGLRQRIGERMSKLRIWGVGCTLVGFVAISSALLIYGNAL